MFSNCFLCCAMFLNVLQFFSMLCLWKAVVLSCAKCKKQPELTAQVTISWAMSACELLLEQATRPWRHMWDWKMTVDVAAPDLHVACKPVSGPTWWDPGWLHHWTLNICVIQHTWLKFVNLQQFLDALQAAAFRI